MSDKSTQEEEEVPAEPRPNPGAVVSWLQLIRLPALFTAVADIAAGHTIKTGGFFPVTQFASLLSASACLYAAGMIFNDVFDRKRDAESGRNRPIPTGRISTKAAAIVGGVLVVAGIAAAGSVSWQGVFIACCLAGCIFAYDGLLKATILGPLAMGGCRFFNIMLGAATDDLWVTVWNMPQLGVAAAIGLYVVGVTWFARTEERTSSRWSLASGALVANLGVAILALGFLEEPPGIGWDWSGTMRGMILAFLVIAIVLIVDRRVLRALQNPQPAYVQASVKLMLLSIITLDATVVLAATGEIWLAFGVALLVVPAMLIGRWLSVT